MKTLLYILALNNILFANINLDADTTSCKKCHPIIRECSKFCVTSVELQLQKG